MKKLKVIRNLMVGLTGVTVERERLSTDPVYTRSVVTLQFNRSTEPFYSLYRDLYRVNGALGSTFNRRAVLVMQRYAPLSEQDSGNLKLPFCKVAMDEMFIKNNIVVLKGTFQNPTKTAFKQPKSEAQRRAELGK